VKLSSTKVPYPCPLVSSKYTNLQICYWNNAQENTLFSKHLHGQDLPTLNLLGPFSTGICIISEWQAPLAPKPSQFFIDEFKVTAVLLNTKSNRKKTLLRTHPLLNPRNVAVSHNIKRAVKITHTQYIYHVFQ